MGQPIAAIVGAAVGALGVLLGSFLTARRQERLERERWRQAHLVTMTAATDSAMQQLTTALAGLGHSMMFSTFRALEANEVMPDLINEYRVELHEGVASSVGAHMRLATLDQALYDRITPQVSLVIRLGGRTFTDLSRASIDFATHAPVLLDRNGVALRFLEDLPLELAGISAAADARPDGDRAKRRATSAD